MKNMYIFLSILTFCFTTATAEPLAGNTTFRFTNPAPGATYAVMHRLRSNLWGNDADGVFSLIDGTLTDVDETYSNSIDNMDVRKTMNESENMSIWSGGKHLIVERKQPFCTTDTVFYNLTGMKQQPYEFRFLPLNLSPDLTAFLIDSYLHTSTAVDLTTNTTIAFSVTAAAGSQAANRFMLVFKTSAVLPVNITSINANRNADRSVAISWKVENELNIEKYTIERSADGTSFTGIMNASPESATSYTRNDLSPLAGDNFYRIKAETIGGRLQYSAIIKVAPGKNNSSISIYPNPVVNKKMQVQFSGYKKGTYQMQLFNKMGQMIWQGTTQVNTGSSVTSIQLNDNTPRGIYQLRIGGHADETTTIQVVIN